jgi:hypothetical protein
MKKFIIFLIVSIIITISCKNKTEDNVIFVNENNYNKYVNLLEIKCKFTNDALLLIAENRSSDNISFNNKNPYIHFGYQILAKDIYKGNKNNDYKISSRIIENKIFIPVFLLSVLK